MAERPCISNAHVPSVNEPNSICSNYTSWNESCFRRLPCRLTETLALVVQELSS